MKLYAYSSSECSVEIYCDMSRHCQVTAVAKKQLCGHVFMTVRKKAIMDMYSVQSVLGYMTEASGLVAGSVS
jgi:hypothetical protein